MLGPNGLTKVSSLAGDTAEGDVVTTTFTVPAGGTADLTCASYTAPAASFDVGTASQQVIFQQSSSAIFGPGT